jgi:photosystem II stability/assembly factor-like uncharacterized protein
MRHLLLWAVLAFCLPLPAAERWELQYFYDKTDSALTFTDFQFLSATDGFAAGVILETNRSPKPVLAVTSDGGRSWNLLPLKETAISVFFLNPRTGWMVSDRDRLWTTADAGRTWTRDPLTGLRVKPIRVFFRDASRGWLLCQSKQAYQTSDGGRTWQLLPDFEAKLLEAHSHYTRAAAFQQTIFLTGYMRPSSRRSRFPVWMEPDLAAIGIAPTTAFLLASTNAGADWKRYVIPNFGEIKRVTFSSGATAFLLVHRLDSFEKPTEILELTLATLSTRGVYTNKNRWITDLAFAGPGRMFAVALDQEGRTAHPAIPTKLRVLGSPDGRSWTEMDVDYRAEARHAILASPDPGHAWIATDTGMILRWVQE